MEFLLIPIAALIVAGAVKLARLRVNPGPSPNVSARFDALERDVQALQQQLNETQERLDFTERLLSKARDERRRPDLPA